jgi:hypothetical protein
VEGSAKEVSCAADNAAGKEDKTALGNAQKFLDQSAEGRTIVGKSNQSGCGRCRTGLNNHPARKGGLGNQCFRGRYEGGLELETSPESAYLPR